MPILGVTPSLTIANSTTSGLSGGATQTTMFSLISCHQINVEMMLSDVIWIQVAFTQVPLKSQ
jgi:hypothetical protein